ncbi:MAG: 3-phosphoserine/phosphohydroxythreonine aminotransferase [Cyclobacteriaceae bacterium]|nr:MAG: 3-phosphoserine/phosphohydroxythreonine aminotransferase [Cyclobacteriaceae bacterium]
MSRCFNFSAGPANLPLEVLEKAQRDLVDYQGTGMSVMEMSHRGKDYTAIHQKAQQDLRTLMAIPENYQVLFVQGGASTQFAAVPLNLFSAARKADYVNTGAWSKKAIAEARRYGEVTVVASSEDNTFNYIPELSPEHFSKDADYVHITSNNTIYGTCYPTLPETGSIPLVCDMSSDILSKPYDVSRFGVIYAGAQKNIGPSGLTIVIVREDLIGQAQDFIPTMMNYQTHADNNSMFNTPACFIIYMAGLVFDWMLANGGVEAMGKRNQEKAGILYQFLDQSNLFKATVSEADRSIMNIPFVTGNADLDQQFIQQAEVNNFKTLKGHRSVGGMRASIYNAFPKEGVEKLVDFMAEFEKSNS